MKIILHLIFILLAFSSATAQNIPIDFEENGFGADWTWTTFENDSNPELEIVDNPDPSGINTSSTVAKFTALQVGQPFAGCETMHGAGIGSFTIDQSNSTIRIMVYKTVISDVGIKLVRADNWSLGEIKVPNTLVNQWEQIEFDFSAHIGNNYDQIVIFPDFNARSSDNIIYFDEVYGEDAVTTNTQDLEPNRLILFPNPAHHAVTIQSDQPISRYEIYTITGALVASGKNIDQTPIDIADLSTGIYLLKAFRDGEVMINKLVKE